MEKTILKKISLLLVFVFAATSISSIKTVDINSVLLADIKASTPNLVKTLEDGIAVKNEYADDQTSFAPYEAKLDEFFYHQADITFVDLVEYMQANNKTAQEAIDYAKAQQTTKGGDPAALKACNDSLTTCTTTLKTYTDEGGTLRNASNAFYGHTTDTNPELSIPDFVQAFIKYAEKTDVYKGVSNGGDVFEGKKWLKNYFEPTACILPTLTNFYNQILSAIATNETLAPWNIKVNSTPTVTSITNNMNNLKTNLNTFDAGVTGTPINTLYNTFYHPLDTTTITNSLKESEIIFYDGSLDNVIKLTTSLGSGDASVGQIATRASGGILPSANYLKNTTKYKDYVKSLIDAVQRITIEVYYENLDTYERQQKWFNDHQLGDVSDDGLVSTVRTAIQNIKKKNCPACPACPECPKCEPCAPSTNTGINESIITSINALEANVKSFVDTCNNTSDNFYIAAKADNSGKDDSTRQYYNDTVDAASSILAGVRSIYNTIDSSTITDKTLQDAFIASKNELSQVKNPQQIS